MSPPRNSQILFQIIETCLTLSQKQQEEVMFSKKTFVQGTLVQEDFCPRRHWSTETFVQGASLKQNGCLYYFFLSVYNQSIS